MNHWIFEREAKYCASLSMASHFFCSFESSSYTSLSFSSCSLDFAATFSVYKPSLLPKMFLLKAYSLFEYLFILDFNDLISDKTEALFSDLSTISSNWCIILLAL